ncbi:MAG TPA: hypothetical protein P5235_01725 [Saprospiraceae bacterium]|nr:hypothetical protein [Saprospiraceae bacterium]HRX28078.1 hypothetical protein [Saprospiraceae bacterium]
MNKFSVIFFSILIPNICLQAQNEASSNSFLEKLNLFSLEGYGAMNYYHFDWQTDTTKRDAIDNERLVLEFGYRWNDKIKLNTEIEFEHGGTGSEVEFDRFEEFGEFEFDINKGGEVLIEQMNLEFNLAKNLNVQVGRVKVPFGLMFVRDEPTDYLTAINSEMESQILPENWTDNGFLIQGNFGGSKYKYHFSLTNGLDGSAFNSANWIKRGNQARFEMVNAENFALCARLDYVANAAFSVGFSMYGSKSTSDNRPKPDLSISTPLGLGEIHTSLHYKYLSLSCMLMYGKLANSETLSNFNRNLSNNLNVKRTPVGASCLGAFSELALKVIGVESLLKNNLENSELLLYLRYDFYDTMFSTEGLIFNNPRWQRQSWSIGTVYKIIEDVQFKLQFSDRKVGAPAPTSIGGGTSEKSIITGFAFEF